MHDWRITDGGQIPGGCGDGMVDIYAGKVCDDGGPSELCTELCTLAPAFVTTWQLTGRYQPHVALGHSCDYRRLGRWHTHINHHVTLTQTASTSMPTQEPIPYGSSKLEAWYFNNSGDKDKLLEVPNLGDVGWRSLEGAFDGCSRLEVVRGSITDRVSTMCDVPHARARPETQSWIPAV